MEHLGVFVGGVIVGDGMDDLSGGDGSFNRVQELDELLMSMVFQAANCDGSIQGVGPSAAQGLAHHMTSAPHLPIYSVLFVQRRARAPGSSCLDATSRR